MTPAYIDTPPGVVVGARISAEVFAPVIKKPIPACSVWIWVSETWVGLFWPESYPALHPAPLQTTISALGTSVAVGDVPLIVPVGQDPIPLIVKLVVPAIVIGQVLSQAFGITPEIVT
jgi:hypothetical protein